jgi:5-methylcytosine-specific restriction endonuclease McrA
MPRRAADPAATMASRDWYSLQRWRRRARHQLASEPLCKLCLDAGRVVPASVADHVEPHRGIWNEFRTGKLQSLCRDCHAAKWSTDMKNLPAKPSRVRDVDADGWPLDRR